MNFGHFLIKALPVKFFENAADFVLFPEILSLSTFKVYEATRSGGVEVYAIKLVSFVALEENIIASYQNEVKMLLRLQNTGKIIRLFD